MNASICPYCLKAVETLAVETVSLKVASGKTIPGVSYACPFCKKIISAQINPAALYRDAPEAGQ